MPAVKIIYTIILFSYLALIGVWCFRYPLSYRMTNGTNHDLVVDHDFTNTEREGVKMAYHIRQIISSILLYSSLLLSVGSYVTLRKRWIEPGVLVRVIMIVSGLIAVILILVNGISFIPGPPIR